MVGDVCDLLHRPVDAARELAERLMDTVGAAQITLGRRRLSTGPGGVEAYTLVAAGSFIPDYAEQMVAYARDPRFQTPRLDLLLLDPARSVTRRGSVMPMHLDEPEAERFYREYLHTFRMGDAIMHRSLELGEPGFCGQMGAVRMMGERPFTQREEHLLHAVMASVGPMLWPRLRPILASVAPDWTDGGLRDGRSVGDGPGTWSDEER